MIIEYEYAQLVERREKLIFIDVRTPKEYEEEHIPEAVNIPVFSNEERERIGILYKNQGKKEATREALKIVGAKVYDMYTEFEKVLKKGKKLVVYCARGGMRSSTVTALFRELSLPVLKLSKGYKGYRNYINEKLPKMTEKVKFIVLYGKTGSGKTKILKEMKNMGYDVLDLEGCANHRGSLLGSIGLGSEYSQKYFESLVFESFFSFKTDTVFVEGESRRIGNIVIPIYLYEKILDSEKIYIETDIYKRINIIKEEYLKEEYDKEEIIKAVQKLSRYTGEKQAEEFIESIKNDEFDTVIKDLIEKYYDRVYKTKNKIIEKVFYNENEKKCASEIIKYFIGGE